MPKKLTLEENYALLRAMCPTAWNKYNKVNYVIKKPEDGGGTTVQCFYERVFVTNDYGDTDVDGDMDEFTLDEWFKMCGFKDSKHYDKCMSLYDKEKQLG